MFASLRHDRPHAATTRRSRSGYQYRFEFVGVQPLPTSVHAFRDTPVVPGTVELHHGGRFLVESVYHQEQPPVAVLRKVRS
jgi:hypothetical protein